jgi:feruloyl-CoA synthase
VIQDIVIAGHDRDEIGVLVFPNIPGCRSLCPELAVETPVDELIEHQNVRAALLDGLRVHNAASFGSSTSIARARFMSEPPDIDANEITDKGYINQRAVLSQRKDLVTLLYSLDDKNILIK